MAGIYIHIPFCRKACHYCNFHFSTSLQHKERLVNGIEKELFLRREELEEIKPETVYFGGGTPSILTKEEVQGLIQCLGKLCDLSEVKEFTFEANPDDLNFEYLTFLKEAGINRLSIGIQSFQDVHLKLVNRAHSAADALNCINTAREAGFTNFSIDLIYGIPGLSDEDWIESILTAINAGVPHISSYCLTVEPKTALSHLIQTGKVSSTDDEQARRQFDILIQILKDNGYLHYEISNFALPGFTALHNTNYWKGVNYLGAGPGAHSFNGRIRSWNISNNPLYLKSIESGVLPAEREILSQADQYNEYIMTGLRTMWGCSLSYIRSEFGVEFLNHLLTETETHILAGHAQIDGDYLKLTDTGKFLADGIASDGFILNDSIT